MQQYWFQWLHLVLLLMRTQTDLMAMNWDELSPAVVYDVKRALSKNTDDKDDQEVLANVFKAAEAVEEFTGILVSLKREIDDSIGLSGETLARHCKLHIVDMLSTSMRLVQMRDILELKMRCSGLGPEREKAPYFLGFLLMTYFVQRQSGKWELEVSEASEARELCRWTIGFTTTGFVHDERNNERAWL